MAADPGNCNRDHSLVGEPSWLAHECPGNLAARHSQVTVSSMLREITGLRSRRSLPQVYMFPYGTYAYKLLRKNEISY